MKEDNVDILLAEDNVDDAELTTRALKKNHLSNTVVHVKDGAEALEFIFCTGKYSGRSKDVQPGVILLDLNMPKVNGIEVLKQLKSNEETKGIPVVMLTSSKENTDLKTCYQLGVNSYIVKPVEFENFKKAIADVGMYWLVLNKRTG